MSEVLSLQGREVFSWARACVKDTLAKLAEEKGVLLDGSMGDWLAGDMLQRMDFALIHGVAGRKEEALLAMGREANTALDALVLARMWNLVAMFEGKTDVNDPAVRATADLIMDKHIATLPKQGAARWPDPMQLVADHYAKAPRGPITATLEDGSVLTTYLLGWKAHRDPKEEPAVHWAHGDKHKWEYRVKGELHRPHEDGPAMICTHYLDSCGQPCEFSGEEYYAHGKHHRPAALGPAVKQWGEAGDPVAEVYYENGELHRDPLLGPAWWLVRDARTDPKAGRSRTETKYYMRGKRHRDQDDGPAVVICDNETGAIVEEQYWRDGKRHRDGAPARIRRDETGKVTLEGWYVDGRLHRDHRDGPALMDTAFDGLDIYCEEYHEDGKWHRPSGLGPAVLNRDRAGEVLREFYIEHGQLHRDPREGPAWWSIHDARTDRDAARPFTELRYCVRGEPHRDEKVGPAWIERDNETGVLLKEEYWRGGELYREDGPAVVCRWPEGGVSYEGWGERMRDPGEGPCARWYDRHGGLTAEEWSFGGGRLRSASEGPGHVHRDLITGEVREEYYVGGEYRRAHDGPAVETRNREGNVVEQAFWDGKEMQVNYPDPARAEAGGDG